jgi:hypothetical protein
MPCEQFPINNPPLNAISGPYNTLAECEQGCDAECVTNQDCCVFVGYYFMSCGDTVATSACTDAGGVFYCDDDPYGTCYFSNQSITGPCDSLTAPFPPSSNYPIFGPYGGPGGGPCGFQGLPVSNCFTPGHCCDGECQGAACN